MAKLSIHNPKRVVEVVPAIFDFSEDLLSGETISTATCTVSVFTGVDPSPSSLLYQTVTVTGNVCEQKIQQGVSGVIYSVLMEVTTSLSRVIEQVMRIAILPDADPAVPTYLPLYLTTPPYPLSDTESYVGFSISSISGRLQYQPSDSGYAIGTVSSISMDLYGGGVSYAIPFESIEGTVSGISMDLYGGGVTYVIPADGAYGTVSGISMDLYGTAVTYSIPYEAVQGTISSISMSLT